MSVFLNVLSLICRSPKRLMCVVLAGLIPANTILVAAQPVAIHATDVSLIGEGVLNGTVLNASAQPIANVQIAVLHGESTVATATSSEDGKFAVRGLRNGAHTIQVGQTVHPVRFWQSEMAPPAAVEQMSIVVEEPMVMGQQSNGDGSVLLPLLIIGGAIGTVLYTTLDDNGSSPAAPVSP